MYLLIMRNKMPLLSINCDFNNINDFDKNIARGEKKIDATIELFSGVFAGTLYIVTVYRDKSSPCKSL